MIYRREQLSLSGKKLHIPARINAPDSGVDAVDFRVGLTDAANTEKDVRLAALNIFKTTLEAGRLDGLETARLIASIHDDIITALFDFATTHVIIESDSAQAERMSLCAVGGYGRGEMAPQSDVDLLFLIADKKGSSYTEQITQQITQYMLYMLWDLGLKVGHATRTVDQCIKLAKDTS